jgi:hypothetical protein
MIKYFLGRTFFTKVTRYALVGVGSWVTANGYADAETVQTIVGAGVSASGIALSVGKDFFEGKLTFRF